MDQDTKVMLDNVESKLKEVNVKMDKLADQGLSAWAKSSWSAWIMLGVVVVLPLTGVIVGYNLSERS